MPAPSGKTTIAGSLNSRLSELGIARTRRLPNADEGAIHAPKESLYVELDYSDRFLSHA
jgi:hypothetical protein